MKNRQYVDAYIKQINGYSQRLDRRSIRQCQVENLEENSSNNGNFSLNPVTPKSGEQNPWSLTQVKTYSSRFPSF